MPAIGANTIVGLGVESAYGTAVTPTRFYEFLDESLDRKNDQVRSNGIRGGLNQAQLGSRRAVVGREAAGDMKLEVFSKGYGIFYKHLLGAVSTTNPGGTAFKHAFSPGNTDGLAFTLQKQFRDGAGTAVATFTYPGSKVLAIEIATATGKLVEMTANFDCQDEVTGIAAAAASYLSGSNPFNFSQSSLTIGGVPATAVTDASCKIENVMKTDRKFLGNQGLKSEPVRNGFLKVTGKLSAEFAGAAQFYDRFVADTSVPLVWSFVGPQIGTTGYYETLTYTIADCRFGGETPKVKGVDIVMTDVPFEAAWNRTDPTVLVELTTTDTNP